MAYATLAQLRTYLKLGASETGDDALLTDLLARAQAMIDHACARTFEQSGDTTRYFDARRDVDGAMLYLDTDLAQITSVTNGDGATIASNQYATEPRNTTPYYALAIKQNQNVAWTWSDTPENAIAIVGRWAYSVTAPADITHACIRLAAWLYRQKDSNADIDRPLVTGDGVMILPSAMPKDVLEILAPFKRMGLR
jgi:hypothetical protein